jgi:ATP-dependent helicase/nuclease subunit A
MDEFQDTNPQQARLLELVRSPDRFYAVGDVNQSIFGFRHAEPAGFERYRDQVEAAGSRLVPLHDNFRSRPQILRAVEKITAGAPGIEERTLLARREFANRARSGRGSDLRYGGRCGGGARDRSTLGGAPRG